MEQKEESVGIVKDNEPRVVTVPESRPKSGYESDSEGEEPSKPVCVDPQYQPKPLQDRNKKTRLKKKQKLVEYKHGPVTCIYYQHKENP